MDVHPADLIDLAVDSKSKKRYQCSPVFALHESVFMISFIGLSLVPFGERQPQRSNHKCQQTVFIFIDTER